MSKHNPNNVRIKRQYFTYLKEAWLQRVHRGCCRQGTGSVRRGHQVQRLQGLSLRAGQPILFMLRQEGSVEKGWRGTPFYWPVIRAQRNTPTAIYASETID